MEEEETVFETTDRLGRRVRYRKVIYERHIPEHPEMADYLEEAADTVHDPDYEVREEPDNKEEFRRTYYKMGLGRDDFEMCFIKVPVYYDRIGGEVATVHFCRQLARGKLLWRRGQN